MVRLIRNLAGALLLAVAAATAAAQDYSFAVPNLQMHAVVQPDASARVVYDITFANQPGAHPIDVVDIGVPHKDYRLDEITASIGGRPLTRIGPSEYVSPGFEVHLGAAAIGPGGSGTLHVEFVMPDMVYQDTTREDIASFRITPTWFGSQYVQGTTDIEVAVHLPHGIRAEEVLHQGREFTDLTATDEGVSAVWRMPNQRLTGPQMVAVSFPKRQLERVVHITRWQLLVRWFGESQGARVAAAILAFCLFAGLYFRFTGGTGFSLFVVAVIGGGIWFAVSPAAHLISLPVLTALVMVNEYFLYHRKETYLPPIAEVEGGGIKRGLTAPEAAVLLELPIARVLGLVIFGLLKKGILRQVGDDPLKVEVDEAFAVPKNVATEKDRAKHYRKAAQKRGTVVHHYEHGFLFLIDANPGKGVAQIDFSVPVRRLILEAAGKMKAFDLSDTQDYYRSIVRRAVNQARSVGDIRQIDKQFEWILLDDDYPAVFRDRPYTPIWHRPIVSGRPSGGGTPAAAPVSPPVRGSTSAGDVGASFAGWAENTMGSFASAIAPGSLKLSDAKAGFLDLGGVDRVTGEFFASLAESRGTSGGRGGGGCACACAGCACACACAGGGR